MKCLVKEKSFINNKVYEEGETVTLAKGSIVGPNLQLIEGDADPIEENEVPLVPNEDESDHSEKNGKSHGKKHK